MVPITAFQNEMLIQQKVSEKSTSIRTSRGVIPPEDNTLPARYETARVVIKTSPKKMIPRLFFDWFPVVKNVSSEGFFINSAS